ncbi:MAG: hypothetical protein LIO45_09030, partial [Clostridiales bacterium]|nr:hypothetical protein [Clostridiales bacterium]
MDNSSKSGKRTDYSQSGDTWRTVADAAARAREDTIDLSAVRPAERTSSVDDAVVDEILRSISEMSDTPVPDAVRTASRPASSQNQTAASSSTIRFDRPSGEQEPAGENEYQAAARHQSGPTGGSQGTDPAYYTMRD